MWLKCVHKLAQPVLLLQGINGKDGSEGVSGPVGEPVWNLCVRNFGTLFFFIRDQPDQLAQPDHLDLLVCQ